MNVDKFWREWESLSYGKTERFSNPRRSVPLDDLQIAYSLSGLSPAPIIGLDPFQEATLDL